MDDTIITVDIIDIALPNDYGVAKNEGRVIFIPGAVVGDRATIRIARTGKKILYGEIIDLLSPSPFRVAPLCRHFGMCGGCSMQNIQYDKQLEIKKRYLAENLRRIGGIDVSDAHLLAIRSSPHTFFYRNKIELSFGEQSARVILGLRERLSPFKSYGARSIPISQCPVSSKTVEKIIPYFTDFAHREGLMAFHPFTKKGILKHLILRESKSTGNTMVILETRPGSLPDMDDLISDMTLHIPEISSIYHAVNMRVDDVIQFDKISHLFGAKSIDEEIAGLTVRTYPGTFTQPNTSCAALLYGAISEQLNLRRNETILGLFCGSGPIEIFLSKKAGRIIGVDSNPANISAAEENCIINKATNCSFYAFRAEDALKRLDFPKPDALVLDPPRTGLSKQGIALALKLSSQRIAYVSCNPATLARDLRELCGYGYVIRQITPFDFFPHTGHLETLTILQRQ